jgi:hypothetical protein
MRQCLFCAILVGSFEQILNYFFISSCSEEKTGRLATLVYSIPIIHTTTRNLPRNLNCIFSIEYHELQNIFPISLIYVVVKSLKYQTLHKYEIHVINVSLVIVNIKLMSMYVISLVNS